MPGLHLVQGAGTLGAARVENDMNKKSETPNTTRTAQLRKMLGRKNGATIAQMQTAFGWQPHTARAAISGLRKRGETVERSDTVKGAVYRIVSAADAS